MIVMTSSKNCIVTENDLDAYLIWKDMTWEKTGFVYEYQVEVDDVCKDSDGITTLFMPTRYNSMRHCSQTCSKFQKSRSPFFKTIDELRSFQGKLGNFGKGLAYFLSVSDNNNDGDWLDFYTGEIADIEHIAPGKSFLLHLICFSAFFSDDNEDGNCMVVNYHTMNQASKWFCDFEKGKIKNL